jgi:hypothetical protein
MCEGEDIILDSILSEGIEYSIELSERVKFDIKIRKIFQEVIDYALMALDVNFLGTLQNENFIIINRQLKIVLVGDKIDNRIIIQMAESLDNFKIFGL